MIAQSHWVYLKAICWRVSQHARRVFTRSNWRASTAPRSPIPSPMVFLVANFGAHVKHIVTTYADLVFA
jgi:hypothetical protein